MMRYPQAIALALSGITVRRDGWINDWFVSLDQEYYSVPVLVRNQAGTREPWSPHTPTDLVTADWRRVDGGADTVEIVEGSWPWAAEQLLAGKFVRRAGWKNQKMFWRLSDGAFRVSFDGINFTAVGCGPDHGAVVASDWVVFELPQVEETEPTPQQISDALA